MKKIQFAIITSFFDSIIYLCYNYKTLVLTSKLQLVHASVESTSPIFEFMKKILKYVVFAALLSSYFPLSNAQNTKLFFDNNLRVPKEKNQLVKEASQSILKNNYDLKYHRFLWYIDPAERYISGSVTSYFVATEQMNSIQFELNADMSADSALFNGTVVQIEHTGNLLNIPLTTTIPAGKSDSITVYYRGTPPTSGFGSFDNYVHNGAPSMWTLSEPYGASDWWPSKNDLTDKIDSTDTYVVMPKGNHAASNGLLISEKPYDSNRIIAHWKHRYPIASYLIAVAVTNYAIYSDYYVKGNDSLEVLNYVYPEDSASIRPATAELVKSIELFEQLFSSYPFRNEKYGHAQCNIGGGMEHQTMTFLGKSSFNPYVLIHELAHQWFGDMITCGTWEDIWLNEGFASYCVLVAYEHLYSTEIYDQYLDGMKNTVLTREQGSVFCNDTTNVSRIFSSALSYYKGALLLHMLRWKLGDEAFFNGIKSYLNDPALKYGFARTSDLKRHLEAQSGKDLTAFFNEWFYGSGVPDYSVKINQLFNQRALVTIDQTQFDSNVDFFEMIVPIKFKGADRDTTILFDNSYSGQTFDIDPGFKIDTVIFDPQKKLLYRQAEINIQHTEQNQKLIIIPNPAKDVLNVEHLPESLSFFQIYNLNGKAVKTIPISNNNTLLRLNIEQLPTGVYVLKAGNSDWTESKLFVVKQ